MSGYPFPPCWRCGKLPTFTGQAQCSCPPQVPEASPDEARQIIRALHRQTMRNPPPLGVPPLRLTSNQAPAPRRTRGGLFDQED